MTQNRSESKSASILPNDEKLSWVDKLAQKQIIKFLKTFKKRHLILRLPDNQKLYFGDVEYRPVEITVQNIKFFKKLMLHGEIGLGESYSDGDWITNDLTGVLDFFISNLEHIPEMSGSKARAGVLNLLRFYDRWIHRSQKNTKANSQKNIQAHYDLSNEFYELWLDNTWTYSSAWFNSTEEPLEQAQNKKYDKLCQKLQLEAGMSVLEIGCGWGGFAIYAAKNYGVKVTGITLSKAQYSKARERVAEANLSDLINIQLIDYRELEGQFDAIASIEMLEAVGHEFLPAYFKQCHRLLKQNGRIGLQVIVCPENRYESMRKSTDWIKKHIFPGGQLPSVNALLQAVAHNSDLTIQHLENFGLHYAKTLQFWRGRFNQQIEKVKALGFDQEFIRKWNYYLAYCEAAFETRNINVSQLILTRPNNRTFGLEV